MIEYRAYIVGHDGHLNGFEPLVCVDDSEAIDSVRVLAELGHSRDAGVAVIDAPVVLAFGIAAAGEGGRQSLRPAAFLASLPASQAFWPRSAAASAPFAVFSAVHFVDGGLPHVCPISAQPTQRPDAERWPGPPLPPHAANA